MSDAISDRTAASLGGALLAAALWLLAAAAPALAAGEMTVRQAHGAAEAGERVLIDVRSPSEWRQTGLPQGAETVTIHHPGGGQGFLSDILAVVENDRSAPIALICATGVRSKRAQEFLEAQGFSNVVSVKGGMFGNKDAEGWTNSGLPTERCTSC